MVLNQMDVIGLFLLTATRQYFVGDAGSKILASFLKNYIDPKAKSEKSNRKNLRTIYNTVAIHTEVSKDENIDRKVLRQNMVSATVTFLENAILIREYADVGLDFAVMAKQEEITIFKRYTSV